MNIIDETGVLAIAARLQRLCDQIRKEGSLIYKESGVDFEPKWFPVIIVLTKKAPLSIAEIANEIGLAHPSVIQLVKELEEKNLVKSSAHKVDKRIRLIDLTPKAYKTIQQMKPVWAKMIKGLEEITDTKNNLMKAMTEVEEKIKQESFYARTTRMLKKKS